MEAFSIGRNPTDSMNIPSVSDHTLTKSQVSFESPERTQIPKEEEGNSYKREWRLTSERKKQQHRRDLLFFTDSEDTVFRDQKLTESPASIRNFGDGLLNGDKDLCSSSEQDKKDLLKHLNLKEILSKRRLSSGTSYRTMQTQKQRQQTLQLEMDRISFAKATFEKDKEIFLKELSELKAQEMKKLAQERDLLERRRWLLESDYAKRRDIEINSLRSALAQLETQMKTKEANWKRTSNHLHRQIDSLKRLNITMKKDYSTTMTTTTHSETDLVKYHAVDSVTQRDFHGYTKTSSTLTRNLFPATASSEGIDSKKSEKPSLIIHYPNKDIKKTLSDGTIIYIFSQSNIVQKTFPNGLNIYEFPNGQIEKHYSDGHQEVYFPDGIVKFILATGEEEVRLNDGTIRKTPFKATR